jgi:sigma-B regulation protein RsbU (phosphoserine phosphatase)
MASSTAKTTDRAQLELRLQATRGQLHEMATMGLVITSIQEIDTVLTVVMDMALRLVNAEVGLIALEREGQLCSEVSWGVDEEFAGKLEYSDKGPLLPWVHGHGEIVILGEEHSLGDRDLRVNAAICLPIKTSKQRLGVMLLVNKYDSTPFSSSDSETLSMLMNFAAVAIDNSILVQEKLRRQKQEQELLIARQIQKTILPGNIDRVRGVSIGAAYHPMGEVGGDFYDVIPRGEKKFLVVLGDVSSHGIPAALIMSATAGIIKSVLSSHPEIAVSELACRTNDLLANGIIRDEDMFVTLFLADFDLEHDRLEYCNAGHPPGLLLRAKYDTVERLTTGGPLLGQFGGTDFVQGVCNLETGCRVFLYTDGLTEASGKAQKLFGIDRTEEALLQGKDMTPNEFCASIKQTVDAFSRGSDAAIRDDFTVLMVEV